MRTWMLAVFLPFAAWLAFPAASTAGEEYNLRAIDPVHATPRAMWVWKTKDILNDTTAVDRIFTFSANRKINRLYLYSGDKSFFEEPLRGKLRAFIARAAAAGIAVEGMDGWPEAASNPENRKNFLAVVERHLDYNAAVPAHERFAGFQSDVEPHAMRLDPNTPEARRGVHDDFVELHRDVARLIKARQPKDFVFGLAIFCWYDNDDFANKLVRDGKEVHILELLAEICDYWALMAYRDTAEATLDITRGELEIAARHGKKVWIGQETQGTLVEDGGGDPPYCTYYQEGVDYMEAELAKIVAALKDHPAYAGLAIHFYDSYAKLPDGPRAMEKKK